MTQSLRRVPLTSFGIIADIQYADIENAYNFSKTKERFYRKSLTLLKEAVTDWKDRSVRCVLQLGDVIDGQCRKNNQSEICLNRILQTFKEISGPVYHVWGNHELYNFSRTWLMTSDLAPAASTGCRVSPGCSYYSVDLHPQLRLVALDCYDYSLLGVNGSYEYYNAAWKTLTNVNKNKELNSPEELKGLNRRFLKYNGGCTEKQLEWIEQELSDARKKQKNVIIIGHCPLLESSAHASNLLWNFEEVLDIIDRYSDCVLCYMAGHNHDGGYDTDDAGVLHITLPGIVEAMEDNPYATGYLYDDQLVVKGNGTVPDFCIELKFCIENEK